MLSMSSPNPLNQIATSSSNGGRLQAVVVPHPERSTVGRCHCARTEVPQPPKHRVPRRALPHVQANCHAAIELRIANAIDARDRSHHDHVAAIPPRASPSDASRSISSFFISGSFSINVSEVPECRLPAGSSRGRSRNTRRRCSETVLELSPYSCAASVLLWAMVVGFWTFSMCRPP